MLYIYPPSPIIGVPSKTASPSAREAWLRQMPLSKPLFEPGFSGVDDDTSSMLCDMYRSANRPNKWANQFMPATQSIRNIEFAAALAKQFNVDFDHVVAMMRYGDNPGWVGCPNNDMIFVQQPIPKTIDELSAIVGGFHKSLFGKPKDPDTAIIDGMSTAPVAMMHAGTFPIVKSIDTDANGNEKTIFQCIYDCSNTTKTIVIKENMYNIQIKPTLTRGLDFEMHLNIEFPPTRNAQQRTSTLPINKMQIDRLMFKPTKVDYVSLLSLRHYLRAWPHARISWIDLSL